MERMKRFWRTHTMLGIAVAGFGQPAGPAPTARDFFLELDGPPATQRRDLKRSAVPGGPYLGIRYNIILFSRAGGPPAAVDPDRTFKTGDCIAIEAQLNRSAYLFVLAEDAGGKWELLLPRDAAGEFAEIRPRHSVMIPEKECFEFTEPARTERLLLLAVSARTDAEEVLRSLGIEAGPSRPRGEALQSPPVAARSVEDLERRLRARDLRLKKIEQPAEAAEKPFAVYAVAPPPSLTIELNLRHE